MNDQYKILEISASQTRPVRQKVLRPHQEAHVLVYPGDDEKNTFHLGAMIDGEIHAILSMYRESAPYSETDSVGWRIRGMASIPQARGSGLGRKLVEVARDRVWETDRDVIWCNARESAFGFYEKLGFNIVGNIFEIEGIGPHAVMALEPTSL
ncbi:MAG: GNAT family N-acetyltransferase [Phycisphaerales bacterium]|nr:GNAT family N-acetyltransferase [Phycisphaerales bacterium]